MPLNQTFNGAPHPSSEFVSLLIACVGVFVYSGKKVEPRDMKGINSEGIMLAKKELGVTLT